MITFKAPEGPIKRPIERVAVGSVIMFDEAWVLLVHHKKSGKFYGVDSCGQLVLLDADAEVASLGPAIITWERK